MYFTGFADEAGALLETQIKATKELGWSHIESRNIRLGSEKPGNIHNISDELFDKTVEIFEESGIQVNCFGSAIANGGKKITDPIGITLEEVNRSIPRMKRLGTKLIRIMSYPHLPEGTDQMEEERFHRLREIQKRFADAGMQAVHENCHNYGARSWKHTLKMLENVPGLKLVFDTGNPVDEDDRSKNPPYPKQSSWEFYQNVKEHIVYIHIKDGVFNPETGKSKHVFPGEGSGDVRRILADFLGSGYDGGISIEPHLVPESNDPKVSLDEVRYNNYVEYGRRLEKIVDEICAKTLVK